MNAKLTMLTAGFCVIAGLAEAAQMMTPFGEKVTAENAWREYPRPQMVRANWTCLNGEWDYAVTSVTNTPGRPEKWNGKILVPFAIESVLSGVGRLLEPDEFLWYTRKIVCHPKPGERTLLHFDGVDFRAMVFIGHREVTDVPHAGAHEPFTLDITDYVVDGENELTVCVWDPTGERLENSINSRGKQNFRTYGCFYTRVSGIWQSVWMETVPERYIRDYNVTTDIDRGTVKVVVKVRGTIERGEEEVVISAFDGDRKLGDFTKLSASTYSLHLDSFECWSPENPKLYHFVARYGADEIRGYFAMRKLEKRRDEKGYLRFSSITVRTSSSARLIRDGGRTDF